MSATNELYVPGDIMEAVEADSITSEATGFVKEFIFDNNPDTYWKPTSTANQTLDIDLGSAMACDGVIFFINNYDTITTVNCDRYWSDNDFGGTTFISGSPSLGSITTTPLRVSTFASTLTYRWWRFVFNTQSEVMELGGLWLYKEFDVGQGNEWPENDIDRFENVKIKLGGGRNHIIPTNRRSHRIYSRQFRFDGDTNFDELHDAHQASGGNRWPLVHYDGSTYRLVRFQNMEFVASQIGYQIYEPLVTFEELPYIHGGDEY